MSVQFDPKTKTVAANLPTQPTKEKANTADPFIQPSSAVSEMELLFSGLRRTQQLRAANPIQAIDIPDLEKDILGPMPKLGGSPVTTTAIIQRYERLQKTLLERRNNFSIALEGNLKTDEAFDIIDRIDAIDHALNILQMNLDKAHRADKTIKDLELEAQRRNS